MALNPFADPKLNKDYLLRIAPVVAGVRAYHQHDVVGLDRIPAKGVIIAVNHSLASYDITLLMHAIFDYTNRIPRALVDRLFFRFPGVGPLMESLGSQEGRPENAKKLLADGHILVVAPGGMREALRPSREKYKVIWDRRRGFAKLAIATGSPVVLAACPAADDLYDIAPSYLTAWAYQTLKIPLFFAKGVGLSLLPKPVKLIHQLSEPMSPPPLSSDPVIAAQDLERFHGQLVSRMETLMADTQSKYL